MALQKLESHILKDKLFHLEEFYLLASKSSNMIKLTVWFRFGRRLSNNEGHYDEVGMGCDSDIQDNLRHILRHYLH